LGRDANLEIYEKRKKRIYRKQAQMKLSHEQIHQEEAERETGIRKERDKGT